jgi:hypothetical protein
VEFINERGEHCAGGYSPTKTLSNGDKEWSVPWQTSTTGSRTIKVRAHIGSNFDDTYAEKSFSVSVTEMQVVPTISSVIPAKYSVNSGESVNVTVKTNSVVNSVELINERGEHIGGAYSPSGTYSNGDKEWSVPWQTSTTGSRTIKARAHIGGNFDDTYSEKSFTLTVVALEVSPYIASVTPEKSSVNSGESVNISVKTNSAVNSVELINERGEHIAGAYSPSGTISNGDKSWSIPWQTSTVGNRTIYARAHTGWNFDGTYAEKSFSITINEGKVVKTMEIVSIAVANPTVRVGEYVWMTVVTSSDISNIWITNETGGETVYELVRSYAVGANIGWDIGWKLGKSGYRTGYVIASNGSETSSKSFNCTAND